MKKIARIVVGVLLIATLSNTKVNAEDYSQHAEAPYLSQEYLNYYLEKNNIEVYDFKDLKKVQKYVANCSAEPVMIEEKKKLGKKPYYARTKNSTGLVYIGKMKKNKPDGIGSILQPIEVFTDPEGSGGTYFAKYSGYSKDIYYARVYVGNFKKGMPQGYGIKFSSPVDEDPSSQGINLGNYYEVNGGDIQTAIYNTVNPKVYEGEFQKGQYSGKGNEYIYNTLYFEGGEVDSSEWDNILEYFDGDVEKGSKLQESLTGTNKDITVYSGSYKKGEKSGQFKMYEWGLMSYEGDMVKDNQTGEGTIYYPLSEQIKYRGELTCGMYQGKGVLYNQDGSINYEGEWDGGDYAQ